MQPDVRTRSAPCEPNQSFVHDLSAQALSALQRKSAERLKVPVLFQDAMARGGQGPEMVVMPPGTFEMGSPETEFGHRPEEGPVHYVCIQRPYAIGRYTITAEEFERFREATGWYLRPELIWARGRFPVINIRLSDATRYAQWLSAETGQRYRLPTEAEWEYACRAGTLTPFHYGESVSCRDVHFNPTFPYEEARQRRRWFMPRCLPLSSALEVGSKPANAWGLHEMHGNVWEFTANPWTSSHIHACRDGSINADVRSDWVVVKGGSWFDPAVLARSAARRPRLRDELDTNLGMRLVRELED